MLSVKQLARLRESAQSQDHLTVYCSSPETDPAAQTAWRLRVQNAARAERDRLVEAGMPVEPFDAAWRHVESILPDAKGALGTPGWVAVASEERIVHQAALPLTPGTSVTWGPDVRVAPYVRAITRSHELLMVLLDARRARVFRVSDARALEVDDLIADRAVSEGAGTGMSKRAAGTTGMRGETRKDAAQRTADVHTERLLRSVTDRVADGAGDVSAVVIGGNDRMIAALLDALPGDVAAKAVERPDLPVGLTDAQIHEEVGHLIQDVAATRDRAELSEWEERDRGLAATGWNEALRRLEEGAVETLLLSDRFVEEQVADAERLLGMAFERGGDARVLAGAAGEALDEIAGGVVGRLRFASSFGG